MSNNILGSIKYTVHSKSVQSWQGEKVIWFFRQSSFRNVTVSSVNTLQSYIELVMLFWHWSIPHYRWSPLSFMWIAIKINPFTGNTLKVVHSGSLRIRERVTSLKGSNLQSKIRLCPMVVLVQRNSAVLKCMPQLSLLTLHCFTSQSGFGLQELDPCQRKLK